jgi:redox-sensitive bicupin YhaK (pirin superfamily)
MTAGSGILHQEMPKGDPKGRMHGFQLWANLPSSLKMTTPRYQDVVARDIPEVTDDDGTRVRVICGDFWGKSGPVDGVAADPRYLDVFVPAGLRKRLRVENVTECVCVCLRRFRYVSRRVRAARSPDRSRRRRPCGDEVTVQAGDEAVRFLLVSGKPIEEPVAWYGPTVMNTREQLQQAYAELREGTFIKTGSAGSEGGREVR